MSVTPKVTLISHTPDPEKLVATAGKLCYSSSDIVSLRDGLTDEVIEKYIDMLVSIGHESVMEHVSFTFGIEGISRACSHQLVRHRIASYSQKSQRYVSENGFDFITPPAISQSPEALAEYERIINDITNDKCPEHYLFNISYMDKEQRRNKYKRSSKRNISDPSDLFPRARRRLIRQKVKHHRCPTCIATPTSAKKQWPKYLCNCVMYCCRLEYTGKKIIPESFYLHILFADQAKINQHIQADQELNYSSGMLILFYV